MNERFEAKTRRKWREFVAPRNWQGRLLASRSVYTNKPELSPIACKYLNERIADLISRGATIVYVDETEYRFLNGNKNTLTLIPKTPDNHPLNHARYVTTIEGYPSLKIDADLKTSEISININCGDFKSSQHFSRKDPDQVPTIYAVFKDKKTNQSNALLLLTRYSSAKIQRLKLTA